MKAHISVLLLPLVLLSCGREDSSSEPSQEERLAAGQWILDDVDASGTLSFAGQTIPFVTQSADVDPSSYFDFNTSPQEVDYDASAEVTVSAALQSFTVPYARSGTGEWEFKGSDSLIVTENNQTTRYFILSWTETRLILRSQQQLSLGGQEIDAEVEATLIK